MAGYNKTNYSGDSKITGIFRAMVIDNNDPKYPSSGRVQIFIPELHGVNLQRFLGEAESFTYKFPGDNIDTSLDSSALNYLKTICPWSYPSYPVIMESGPGLYNARAGGSSTNDNPDYGTADNEYPNKFTKPAAMYESASNIHTDAFAVPSNNMVARGNSHGAEFRAPSYPNAPKGAFAIPRVGAQLLVAFFGGDVNFPVYFGALPSITDMTNVFSMDGTSPGVPKGFESPVDTANLVPPVKPTPSADQVSTQQAAQKGATGIPISRLPAVKNVVSLVNVAIDNILSKLK